MVKKLKSFMEDRIKHLLDISEEHIKAIKTLEQKLKLHKLDIKEIEEQINDIEKLGF